MIPTGYSLVFAEEFDGPLSVSNWGTPAARWIAHTPYAGDFGEAWFTGPNEPGVPSPFSVADSVLTIKAWRDPGCDNHWRSGLLSSVDTHGNGFSLALGFWECRMKCPTGAGVWPAFWLCGISGCNRARTCNAAEIDVIEAYGIDMHQMHSNVHVWSPQGVQVGGAGHQCWTTSLTDSYRSFGCLIREKDIQFYIDGHWFWSTPTPIEAKEPLYCMVNLALGGGWPISQTPDPSYLKIDYIRAYSK